MDGEMSQEEMQPHLSASPHTSDLTGTEVVVWGGGWVGGALKQSRHAAPITSHHFLAGCESLSACLHSRSDPR